ncbi:MAG: Ig-like domain-containing protein [Clostridiales bacterium]|nr:Ig-like domain-containing protein [Clostridiales bacterium]
MKKLKWLVLVMCCVLGLSVFVACGGSDNGGGDNTPDAVKVNSITLAPARALEIGQSTVLTAIVDPMDATSTITWTTSAATIATVTTQGLNNGVAKIDAIAAGEATITATADGKIATCKITVTEHIIPYYFIAGQSGAAYFNWNNYSREDDLTAARVLKPVEGSNEKVFKTTVDLFANDQFKICAITNVAADNHWATQLGGAEAASDATDEEKAELAEKLKVSGATEKTVLPSSKLGGGNPPNFQVTAEGKYEITLDLTNGDAPELSYKKVGATDPVAWHYDVVFHGNWGGGDDWTGIKFGTTTFDENTLTATADIELTAANFGVKTAPAGTMDQVGWFNSDKMELAEGVTTITLNAGGNAACTAAGTYNVTITMNADGSIAKILFNSFTAAAAE